MACCAKQQRVRLEDMNRMAPIHFMNIVRRRSSLHQNYHSFNATSFACKCQAVALSTKISLLYIFYCNVHMRHVGWLLYTCNCGLHMRQKCRERFPRHLGLAIPTCITAHKSRTRRDACWDRWLAVFFEVGGGENVPGIPGSCTTRNSTYLVRVPWQDSEERRQLHRWIASVSKYLQQMPWYVSWVQARIAIILVATYNEGYHQIQPMLSLSISANTEWLHFTLCCWTGHPLHQNASIGEHTFQNIPVYIERVTR